MHYRIWDFVNANNLKLIYYGLFKSHINYVCIKWGQNISAIKLSALSIKRHLELSL